MSGTAPDAVEAALTSLGLDYENPRPGAFLVKLPGQHKLATMTWLVTGEHSLGVEAFFCRQPDENHEAFYRFLLDKPAALGPTVTSNDVAFELDWYLDWKVTKQLTVSVVAAWASPGEAVAQAYGRTQDFWYSMLYGAYNY